MGPVLDIAGWALGLAALSLFFAWVYLMLRARRLYGRFGSFQCSTREDTQSGWVTGIGMYGTESLTWYRLVSFSRQPAYALPRRGLEVSVPYPLTADGSVVVVSLTSGQTRVQVAVEALTYNGLVSWVESGPPAGRG
ncbi:DUF2550 domain-containing protein [Schaalia sp. 19OD2882]|uniref:DUF2550 family protein n=1 Tax=Schaalia sp. 19OD2882 TaxID=2794089 RepID=UPI001C1EF3AA|nr:DUF2550 family protein [Schaalia sp. 19OD2882]QWW20364.1 DUF2550 domain-containing protein [Schaalia sp. 19OD2882]